MMQVNLRNQYDSGMNTHYNAVTGGGSSPTATALSGQYGVSACSTTAGKRVKGSQNPFMFKLLNWTQRFVVNETSGYFAGSNSYHHITNMYQYFGSVTNFYADARSGSVNWSSLEDRSLEKILEKARGSHASLSVDLAEGRQTVDLIKSSLKFRKNIGEFVGGVISKAATERSFVKQLRKTTARERFERRWKRAQRKNRPLAHSELNQVRELERKALLLKDFVSDFTKDVVSKKGFKKIRRGPTQNQRRLDYVNNKWLEARYGWGPLVNSVYDLADALRKSRLEGLVYLKGRSGERRNITLRNGDSSYSNPLVVVKIDCSYRVERGAAFSLPPGPQVQDFTSLNPALIAWELTPFSFIYDWFLGVGQCLENWENYFTFRNHYRGGYITWTTMEDRSGFMYGYTYENTDYWPRWSTTETSAKCVYKYKERQSVSSLPTPGGPRVKLGLNAKRLMDVAALVGGAVKRFR